MNSFLESIECSNRANVTTPKRQIKKSLKRARPKSKESTPSSLTLIGDITTTPTKSPFLKSSSNTPRKRNRSSLLAKKNSKNRNHDDHQIKQPPKQQDSLLSTTLNVVTKNKSSSNSSPSLTFQTKKHHEKTNQINTQNSHKHKSITNKVKIKFLQKKKQNFKETSTDDHHATNQMNGMSPLSIQESEGNNPIQSNNATPTQTQVEDVPNKSTLPTNAVMMENPNNKHTPKPATNDPPSKKILSSPSTNHNNVQIETPKQTTLPQEVSPTIPPTEWKTPTFNSSKDQHYTSQNDDNHPKSIRTPTQFNDNLWSNPFETPLHIRNNSTISHSLLSIQRELEWKKSELAIQSSSTSYPPSIHDPPNSSESTIPISSSSSETEIKRFSLHREVEWKKTEFLVLTRHWNEYYRQMVQVYQNILCLENRKEDHGVQDQYLMYLKQLGDTVSSKEEETQSNITTTATTHLTEEKGEKQQKQQELQELQELQLESKEDATMKNRTENDDASVKISSIEAKESNDYLDLRRNITNDDDDNHHMNDKDIEKKNVITKQKGGALRKDESFPTDKKSYNKKLETRKEEYSIRSISPRQRKQNTSRKKVRPSSSHSSTKKRSSRRPRSQSKNRRDKDLHGFDPTYEEESDLSSDEEYYRYKHKEKQKNHRSKHSSRSVSSDDSHSSTENYSLDTPTRSRREQRPMDHHHSSLSKHDKRHRSQSHRRRKRNSHKIHKEGRSHSNKELYDGYYLEPSGDYTSHRKSSYERRSVPTRREYDYPPLNEYHLQSRNRNRSRSKRRENLYRSIRPSKSYDDHSRRKRRHSEYLERRSSRSRSNLRWNLEPKLLDKTFRQYSKEKRRTRSMSMDAIRRNRNRRSKSSSRVRSIRRSPHNHRSRHRSSHSMDSGSPYHTPMHDNSNMVINAFDSLATFSANPDHTSSTPRGAQKKKPFKPKKKKSSSKMKSKATARNSSSIPSNSSSPPKKISSEKNTKTKYSHETTVTQMTKNRNFIDDAQNEHDDVQSLSDNYDEQNDFSDMEESLEEANSKSDHLPMTKDVHHEQKIASISFHEDKKRSQVGNALIDLGQNDSNIEANPFPKNVMVPTNSVASTANKRSESMIKSGANLARSLRLQEREMLNRVILDDDDDDFDDESSEDESHFEL